MPRPNKPRSLLAERHLAARISYERERRGWTYDGLATRMRDVGCPISPSALYKSEKGDPPRRIVVDELVALSQVFGVSTDELLLPPEVAAKRQVAALALAWQQASDRQAQAIEAADAAWDALTSKAAEFPDLDDLLPH